MLRRPGQSLDSVPIRAYRNDFSPVSRIGAGVEERLEVGTGTGHQHHEPRSHPRTLP